jgi:hypothetical protein
MNRPYGDTSFDWDHHRPIRLRRTAKGASPPLWNLLLILCLCGYLSTASIVERSPVGRPSSLALSTRRIILPLRVLWSWSRN